MLVGVFDGYDFMNISSDFRLVAMLHPADEESARPDTDITLLLSPTELPDSKLLSLLSRSRAACNLFASSRV